MPLEQTKVGEGVRRVGETGGKGGIFFLLAPIRFVVELWLPQGLLSEVLLWCL